MKLEYLHCVFHLIKGKSVDVENYFRKNDGAYEGLSDQREPMY